MKTSPVTAHRIIHVSQVYKYPHFRLEPSSRNLAIPHDAANSTISHCANPGCAAPLRYLRDGRLFQFEVRSFSVPDFSQPGEPKSKKSRQVTHFWLCGECSSNLTLTFEQAKGVRLIPLPPSR